MWPVSPAIWGLFTMAPSTTGRQGLSQGILALAWQRRVPTSTCALHMHRMLCPMDPGTFALQHLDQKCADGNRVCYGGRIRNVPGPHGRLLLQARETLAAHCRTELAALRSVVHVPAGGETVDASEGCNAYRCGFNTATCQTAVLHMLPGVRPPATAICTLVSDGTPPCLLTSQASAQPAAGCGAAAAASRGVSARLGGGCRGPAIRGAASCPVLALLQHVALFR